MEREDPILDLPSQWPLPEGRRHAPPKRRKEAPPKPHPPALPKSGRIKVVWAYLLLVTFGFVGAHKFYVGKPKVGCVYFVLGYLGPGGWLVPLFGFIGPAIHIPCTVLLVLFLLVDLLTLPRQVRKRQQQIEEGGAQTLVQRLKARGEQESPGGEEFSR
jgi:hypothetical protein